MEEAGSGGACSSSALVYEVVSFNPLKEGGYEDAVLLESMRRAIRVSRHTLVHGKAKVTSLCGLILFRRGSLSHFCNEAAFIEISGRSRHNSTKVLS